ncbi:pilus assembly protein [Sedimenticola selenatireducens]|nr:PilC/PilY family type IV pilus protein [Sedimenticola selenatireducens]
MNISDLFYGSKRTIQAICYTGLIAPTTLLAAVSGTTSADFSGVPTVSSPSSPPLVMLAMSVDHQLTHKAYTDYSDLDGDGQLDTGYTDTFDYYGYFDSNRCYSYESANNRFIPQEAASGVNGHECSIANRWSGNFLNWSTMTRMDVVRRVLYGGLRSQDNSQTNLKRAYIPKDVHAFAKVFAPGSTTEMLKYTPYSKTAITLCNVSTSTTSDPYVRIADGSYPRWAAAEVTQCQWNNGSSTPSSATNKLDELAVQVRVCKDATTIETNCKLYPNNDYKPTGLLQRYGEDGILRFGLMTGSYDKNTKGGMLRKNIMPLAGNSNASDDEIDTSTGRFINQATTDTGIINSLNRIQIAKYNFTSNNYDDCNTHSITVADFKSQAVSTKRCSDWGNPLGEIYMEALRYFSGQTTPTASFDGNDTTYIAGLNKSSWSDPMSADEWCASCAIVAISTGLNSFDRDDLSTAGITGLASITTATNNVGNIEMGGSFAGNYLHGGSDGRCTSKWANTLADITGICPEVPQLEGGFQIAGLAHHAHITDLRTGTGYQDTQKVDTYAVALAESLPSFSVKVGGAGKEITFLPFCESNKDGGTPATNDPDWQACSITNVIVESQYFYGDGNLASGSLLISWEDSLWGNDYDLDGMERIEFCVKGYCDEIGQSNALLASDELRIRTRVVHAYAGNALRFGYTITGSTADGVYYPVVRPGGQNFSASDMDNDNAGSEPAADIREFTVGSSTATLLNNPLYYAAKFGSYTDLDNSGDPTYNSSTTDTREWDNEDTDGNQTPDGIPDNYFPVRNPSKLETQLGKVFGKIVSRVSSGTAAAVVSNSTSGEGALYQALYYPQFEDNDNSVSWVVLVQGMFVDDRSNLREDANGNGYLDDCNTDPAIDIYLDTSTLPYSTKIKRYISSNCIIVTPSDVKLDNTLTLTPYTTHPVTDLRPIWNARDELGKLTNTNVVAQRTYANSASTGRHILTSTNGSTLINFDASTFGSTNYTYLDVIDEPTADNVINYVRGKDDITGFRTRSVDFDSSTTGDEVWRLGDIIHSSPAVIGTPSAGYETLYNDTSYLNFKTLYVNRRNLVIVGANDGMIHAFNGGFWDDSLKAFKTTNSGETAHPLGSELWGYVPKALLPHLKWLTEPDYPHVYYMDGRPLIFDANIFTADADHPHGWCTVMVMGMRFGGGPITVDVNNDSPGNTTDDETLRSSYVVLDITNPEVAPKLIAELSHPNLGYTTGMPTVIKKRSAGGDLDWTTSGDNTNQWELVFGSGPIGLTSHLTGTSTQNAQLFRYNLVTKSFVAGFAPADLGEANSFVGSATSTDWDSDFIDDIVYFGIAGGTEAMPDGKLKRLRVSDGALSTLLATSQPFTSKPATKIDTTGKKWITAGTGRFFATTDSDNVQTSYQQSMYGVKEPVDGSGNLTYATVSAATLVDTTNLQVFTDGSLLPTTFTIGGNPVTTYDQLVAAMATQPGWKNDFPTTSNTEPNTRNVTNQVITGDLLIFTDYTPGEKNLCDAGSSRLNVTNYATGTAIPYGPIGTDSSVTNGTAELASSNVALGVGLASDPVIHKGSGGGTTGGSVITVFTQGSAGDVTRSRVFIPGLADAKRRSWRQIDFAN